MKRLLFLIGTLIFVTALPAAAQEETVECDIHLVEAIAMLSQAQLSADAGDANAALQGIDAVQAQLAAIVESCAGEQDSLDRTYTSPDRSFAFDYPGAWSLLSPTRGVIVLSNDPQVLNDAIENSLEEPIKSGAVVVVVGVLDTEEYISADETFDDFVAEFQDEGLNPTIGFVGPVRTPEGSRYEAREIGLQSEIFEGVVYLLNLETAEKVMVIIGMAPVDEYATFAPVIDTIMASARYGDDVVAAQAAPPSSPPVIVDLPPGRPLDEITYARAISLPDLNEDINFRNAMLSPDGTMIGWYMPQNDGAMCVYTFADEQTVCSSIPEVFHGSLNYIIWSPDSRYITFSQDFILRLQETDIWLYEVATRRFTNATDDQVDDWSPLGSSRDASGPVWIDIAYSWGPDLNLYFARIELPDPSSTNTYTTDIYRLNPDSGETTLIRDITEAFNRYSIYQNREIEFGGSLAVSPDGQQIAMIVLEPDIDSSLSGIWIMPLDGSQGPQQWVGVSALTTGLVEDAQRLPRPALPVGLAWSADGRSLYTLATTVNSGSLDLGAVVYQIDAETGALTPLNDFSAYARTAMLEADDSGYPPAFYVPRGAVLSSDSTTPLIFHAFPQEKVAGLSALRMVDGELQPELLLTIDDYGLVPATVSSVARDGKLLLWGYLFLPEE